MAIYANPSYFEADERGDLNHVLVAVKYTGPSRFYSNNSATTQGRWPTRSNFLNGIWYVGLVPESTPQGVSGEGVAWFERNEDFVVEYDPEMIARALIEDNGGELTAGGPIGDNDTLPGFDQKVEDALGLEDPVDAGQTRAEQLREIAGLSDAPTDAVEESEADYLVNEYDRTELKEAVKSVRADADEFNLRGAKMREMADYLVEQTEDADRTVREAN